MFCIWILSDVAKYNLGSKGYVQVISEKVMPWQMGQKRVIPRSPHMFNVLLPASQLVSHSMLTLAHLLIRKKITCTKQGNGPTSS